MSNVSLQERLFPALQSQPAIGYRAPARLPLEVMLARHPTRPIASRASLFADGDRRLHVYQVVSGGVVVSKCRGNGARQILRLAQAGSFVTLASSQHHMNDAHALEKTRIRAIPAGAMLRLSSMEPAIAAAIADLLSLELQAVQAHTLIIGRPGANCRLSAFLLDLIDHGSTGSLPMPVYLPLLRVDIADYLCLSMETVCRAFTDLKQAGALRMAGARKILSVDREILSGFARD